MFNKTALYYDSLYEFKDYGLACSELFQLLQQVNPGAGALLDVGCGTGKHLAFLQRDLEVEGLDLNPALLAVARERCPQVTFHEGDMTAFNLGKTYDAVVSLFSSIAYVRTVTNLNKTIQTMADHLSPGGMLLIEPWIYPENYWVDRLTANFVDKPDLKIAWMYQSKQEQLTSVFNIHYMVASPQGVSTFEEEHIMGLWTDTEYREAFKKAGISPTYDENGFFGRGMYYGRKES